DTDFIYCDTDSLYFKQRVKEKLPDELFTEFSLGTWGIELDDCPYFYVLNHKKYCYVDEQGKIQVRSGGIPHDSFNRDMSFKEFVDTQFSDGVEIETDRKSTRLNSSHVSS